MPELKYKQFPTTMIKCGIKYNCITDSVIYVLRFVKIQNEISKKIMSNKNITLKLTDALKETYKQFSKKFFSKKSVSCMKSNCKMKESLPDIDKQINNLDIIIKESSKKPFLLKYIYVLKLLHKILKNINNKYRKNFSILCK
jgi:hypothetical protein